MDISAVAPIRVLIADDQRLVRRGLQHILCASPGIVVIGEASDYVGITQVLREQPCDVLILDIAMPDKDGIEILHLLKKREPMLRIMVLSSYGPEQFAVRALKAGAAAYMTKDSTPDELLEAVRVVARGKKYISQNLAESLANHVIHEDELMPHQQLSNREFQTVRMIASGQTRTEIAKNLSISPKTVSVYRSRVFEKMGVRTNAQLTHYAIKHGLLDSVSAWTI
ncbi:response regulator transcription factor [Glaciimonas sp. PAMC28666]|uniref:response regulator n=1 Tax=Glaciimonas sp. PAMC28666 TaxID=2807626 RepID=UPI001964E64D|nr:response regulator transcription factor [Glaciimonas sp. PAMC28666]QRX83151.1 response regulator transcription factor [Glaciimonas sp. PAMC28666]